MRGHVDREAFRDGPKVENQWTEQRDGLPVRIQPHVSIADWPVRLESRADDCPSAMFAIEAARLHPVTNRGIERAASLFREGQRKLHGLIEHHADWDGHANPRGELHQLARRVKSGTARLDVTKPAERPIHTFGSASGRLDRHHGAHQHLGADVAVVSHLAFESASVIAK